MLRNEVEGRGEAAWRASDADERGPVLSRRRWRRTVLSLAPFGGIGAVAALILAPR